MGNDPPNGGQFKQGWAGGPGRPRGSKTRVKADLAQLILDGAAGGGVCVRRISILKFETILGLKTARGSGLPSRKRLLPGRFPLPRTPRDVTKTIIVRPESAKRLAQHNPCEKSRVNRTVEWGHSQAAG
jgi:hypothetical protein